MTLSELDTSLGNKIAPDQSQKENLLFEKSKTLYSYIYTYAEYLESKISSTFVNNDLSSSYTYERAGMYDKQDKWVSFLFTKIFKN